MLVPYLAMDTDNRKREGETQPHWEGFKTPSPKRSRQSGDDLLDDEADQEVTSVSKCRISFRVIVLSIEGVCL